MKAMIFFLLLTQGLHAKTVLNIIGVARVDGQIVYTEKHEAILNPEGFYDLLKTDYVDSKDVIFARITSDFKKNQFIPDSEFYDFRNSEKVVTQLNNSGKSLLITKITKTKTISSNLELMANSVLSQGFHNYIVANFELIKNNKREIYFIVTEKNDQYRFTISLESPVEKAENEKLTIKIRPSTFFLKSLLPPLKLVYEIKSKRLLSFQGLTNIEDPDGDSYNAIIEYTYK